jgi:DivIVA domain-containing protein
MTDETFRLTPLDIRRYDFGSALRGYDKTRVDQFRDQVAEEVERLVRHAQDLDAKARGFHEQLRAFRERDKALNEALVSAQQLRGEIREQAEREAQLILREARAEAEKLAETIRADAERTAEALRAEVKRLEDEINTLTRARRTYLAQLRTMIERQLTEVQAAEAPSGPPPAPARANDNKGQPEHPTPAWLDSLVKE